MKNLSSECPNWSSTADYTAGFTRLTRQDSAQTIQAAQGTRFRPISDFSGLNPFW